MSISGAPAFQLAYQGTFQKGYAAAIRPYTQTANRYGSGPSGDQRNSQGGTIEATQWVTWRHGRHARLSAIGGNVGSFVTSTGGSGYAANDLVTFAPINGGRPIVVKVVSVSSGAPTLLSVVDPGGGMTGGADGTNRPGTSQTAALTQASTTGVGTGATWTAQVAVGLGLPAPMPSA